MKYRRNEFIKPTLYDPEYLLMRLRREDLRILIEEYLPKDKKAVVMDFGSRRALYKGLFSGQIEKFLTADLAIDGRKAPYIDALINKDGLLDYPSQSIDVVLSLQVLEHVEDVDTYLAEANRILKPGGLLWLTTHGTWPYHPTPDDYRRWTLSGLRKTISEYFELVDTQAMMGGPAYAIMIYMHLLRKASLKLNALQAKFLNAVTSSRRWGKYGDRAKRIKNPLFYIGTMLFRITAVPVNLIMWAIDSLTPTTVKINQAAVYRIAGRKRGDYAA